MRVQMGLEPYIQPGGFLSHCQVCFPWGELKVPVFLLQRMNRASLSPHSGLHQSACSLISETTKVPWNIFYLNLKNKPPWRMKALAQFRIPSTDSKTAAFLSMQIPSMPHKTSHKPEINDHSLTGSE